METLTTLNKTYKSLLMAFLAVMCFAVVPNSLTAQDADGDGVLNGADLDDDNDGILDTEEKDCANNAVVWDFQDALANPGDAQAQINAENYTVQGATLSLDRIEWLGGGTQDEYLIENVQWVPTYALRTGISGTGPGGSVTGERIEQVWGLSDPVCDLYMRFNDLDRNDEVYIEAYAGGSIVTLTAADFTLPGTADPAGTCVSYLGGNNFQSICNPPIANLNNSLRGAIDIVFPACVDSVKITFFDFGTTTGGSFSVDFLDQCNVDDCDGDGIPNYLDADSDNDGCTDATESGSSDDGNAAGQVAGPYGANGFADALETAPESGIPNYTTSAAVCDPNDDSACDLCDDGDGIANSNDLDDDNDGIPDLVEDPCGDGGNFDVDMCDIDNSVTPQTDINGEGFDINGATLTLTSTTWNGGSAQDEYEINDTHLNGTCALRTGVTHSSAAAVRGPNDENVTQLWGLDEPVTNVCIRFNDLDRNDEVIINGKLNGTNVALTAADWNYPFGAGACPTYLGNNTWQSTCQSPAPNLNNSIQGAIDICFPGQIDEVEVIFYDFAATNGGSFSVNFFDGGCDLLDTDGDGIPDVCDLDSDNDGCFDAAESGAGVDVNADGTVDGPFGPNGLADGVETAPESGTINYTVSNSDGQGERDFQDALTTECQEATIGNYVWIDENADGLQDAGEPGIPGVLVTLLDANGAFVGSTTTDANGGYLFTELEPGTYTVEVDANTLPAGVTQTMNPTLPGDDFGNQTSPYTLTVGPGDENLTADFGYIWGDPNGNTGNGALGDRIWIDTDGDGMQDPDEIGVPGVQVQICYDSDGDGDIDANDGPYPFAVDANGNLGSTTTTGPDGRYIFSNLPAGLYAVKVDPTTLPNGGAGYTQTGDPDHFGETDPSAGGNDNQTTAPVVLGPGDVYLNVDFGYQPDPAIDNTIGDKVFFDADADGTQDANEPGIAGVTVALYDANGNLVGTTETDENGDYLFTGLPDGTYSVLITDTDNVLEGLEQSADPDGGNDNFSTTTVAGGQTDLLQDFGYTPEGQDPGEGAIGDTVFLDANGNGVPDPGEGLEGVTVKLLDAAGNPIASTVTDENGMYYFGGLSNNDAYGTMVDPTTLPAGLVQTVDPDGTLDDMSTTTLTPGAPVDLTLDYGYAPAPGSEGSIGTTIWEDRNADGVNDGPLGPDGVAGTADDEMPIEGVKLELYMDTNGDGLVSAGEPLMGTATTDASGNYLFDNLPTDNGAGVDYVVDVTDGCDVLAGYWHSLGAAGVNDNSQPDTYATTLGGGNPVDDLAADFGYYKDPLEPGVAGVELQLTIDYPDGSQTIMTTTTDANGFYEFCNLLLDEDQNGAGGAVEPTFTVEVVDLPGAAGAPFGSPLAPYVPTGIDDPNGNGTDLNDSDDWTGVTANTTQGANDVALTNAGCPNAGYDFGYRSIALPVELTLFEGVEENCEINLRWVTATEENTAYFIVEESRDGTSFTQLTKVNAAGNSNEELEYTVTDEFIQLENYYRLRMVDIDGSIEFSETIRITASCFDKSVKDGITDIYPNPTSGQRVNIKFYSSRADQDATLQVIDMLGRTLMAQTIEVLEGQSIIQLDPSDLAQGTYYVRISGNGWNTKSMKFVKVSM